MFLGDPSKPEAQYHGSPNQDRKYEVVANITEPQQSLKGINIFNNYKM